MIGKKQSYKDHLKDWDDYVKNIVRSTPVPINESAIEKEIRKKELLKDFAAFCKYYFPNYTKYEFGDFHLEAHNAIENDPQIYAVLAWARDHAKSALVDLFEPIFLMCKGEPMVMVLISHSGDNAEKLITPLRLQLENNQRLINDYGVQKTWKQWEKDYFITQNGAVFVSFGWTQGIRGTRVEDVRPTLVIFDDLDFDEDIHNPDRSDKKWDFVEKSAIPIMSIDNIARKIFLGNIISKHGVIARAALKANYYSVVNILDDNGKPTWHQRFTLAQVLKRQSEMSYFAFQSEYMNNPITKGNVFKEMVWGKIPPLSKFKFLVEYCDPSYKSHERADYKGKCLMGFMNNKYYVIQMYLEQTTTFHMIDWSYKIEDYVNGQTNVYRYMESVLLQEIFFQEFDKEGKKRGKYLSVQPYVPRKVDKFHRIVTDLEVINRNGQLILNEDEKHNPHFQRLEEQFLALSANSKAKDDGPDAVSACKQIIESKHQEMRAIVIVKPKTNTKKW